MASIEYTQRFTHVASASGATGLQYCHMGVTPPPLGSIFVIKYLSISSSSGLNNTTPAWNVQVVTSDDAIGTDLNPILSTNTGGVIAANTALILFQSTWAHSNNTSLPFTQFIMDQAYLGVNANMTAAGTLTVTVSYLVIPNTNVLSNNFGNSTGVAAPGNVPILSAGSYTRPIQSIVVTNYTDATNTYTVTPVLLSSGSPVAYLGNAVTIAVGGSACWNMPVYLQVGLTSTLGLVVTSAGAGIAYYVSYLSEQY